MKSPKPTSHTRVEVAGAHVSTCGDDEIQVTVTFTFSPWDAVSVAPLSYQRDALEAVETIIDSGLDALDRADRLAQGTLVVLEHTNTFLSVHDPLLCELRPCTVHNRSEHLLRGYPQVWRADRGFMERRCPHGVGHPDPDEAHSPGGIPDGGVHGCDGCCAGAYAAGDASAAGDGVA